ncbi:MAG TPA: NAD(P)-dependent oxidoreductase [Candidatus Binatia bacterium]|nr:NAD(P)-dependent oxidoreductase [Candidatus Binatia bacterium]
MATPTAPTIALLGLGRMGAAISRAIARRLADDGGRLVLYNRTASRAEELAAELRTLPGLGERITVAGTPAEAAAGADVVLSSVADDAALGELYRRPDGVLAGLRPPTVAVDLSTVLPTTVRGLATDVLERTGAAFLDSPVSGSVATAEAGQLTLMVGGDPDALERARPVLERFSARIFHLGPNGAGATLKLAVNTVILALNEAVAEALVLAERAGVERERAYAVFEASAIGAPFVHYKRAAFLDPASVPPAFSLALAEKDIRLALGLAAEVGARLPVGETILATLQAAEAAIGPDRDFSEVATYLRGADGRDAPPGT